MQMIDVVQKLREIADRSPEEIGRAIAAAEAMSGKSVTEEMTEKQKKYFGGGKKDDDKDYSKKTSKGKGEKPDFLDLDKDGDKEESMKKAAKDKEDKKVDEDVQITLTGSDAVLAEILKLAGQIGAKTSGGPSPVSAAPSPLVPPKPMGMPSTGPVPSLDSMLGDKGPDMGGPSLGGMEDEVLGDSYNASTTPNPVTMGADAAVPSGDDLAKSKLTAPKVALGDNPLQTARSF
jgi:hypothetical protein